MVKNSETKLTQYASPEERRAMGEVRVGVRLGNAVDDSLHLEGRLPAHEIRTLWWNALVDTGAVRCCIPEQVAEQLGLVVRGHQTVTLADGSTQMAGVSGPVLLELEGRSTIESCLILGDDVLIGQTVLETTDLFVDCAGRRVVPNPAHPNGPVLSAK